jgi:hypothetical protein
MVGQTFKTAQGQSLDMAALKLRNETERAVGNLKVNARGDLIDESNRILSNRKDQVLKNLEKTSKLTDIPVTSGKPKRGK